jgi:hypothetical protein
VKIVTLCVFLLIFFNVFISCTCFPTLTHTQAADTSEAGLDIFVLLAHSVWRTRETSNCSMIMNLFTSSSMVQYLFMTVNGLLMYRFQFGFMVGQTGLAALVHSDTVLDCISIVIWHS